MSQSNINPAPIDDKGPLVKKPDIVGICAEHGFWFEMRREQESCPESHCMATVHVYRWAHAYDPDERGYL